MYIPTATLLSLVHVTFSSVYTVYSMYICTELLYTDVHFVCGSLLVLGMDHYGVNAWKEIQQNILPTKTLKQVSSQDQYVHSHNHVLV